MSVAELAEDEDVFVVVLIGKWIYADRNCFGKTHNPQDEVESLTAARAGAVSGQEPSDALRVVNALLTQLDKLKHKSNVLVMSTSNLVTAIGKVDRINACTITDCPELRPCFSR